MGAVLAMAGVDMAAVIGRDGKRPIDPVLRRLLLLVAGEPARAVAIPRTLGAYDEIVAPQRALEG